MLRWEKNAWNADPMNVEYTYDVFDSINDRWPKLGDRLFVVGRDAMLAQDAPERTYRLTRGYKCAGDVLIQTALEDAVQRHNLVFPILFHSCPKQHLLDVT